MTTAEISHAELAKHLRDHHGAPLGGSYSAMQEWHDSWHGGDARRGHHWDPDTGALLHDTPDQTEVSR